jgi:ABC-type branched-subunit amino acid transport system ATPase component
MDALILDVRGVEKNFGHTHILKGIDIEVKRGSLHAIIGPNGAGKTTLFNVITGRFPLDKGEIKFNGTDVTNWSPERRLSAGIARAFQIVNIFPNMTVLENVVLPAVIRHGKGMNMISGPWKNHQIVAEAEEVLKTVGLEKSAKMKAGLISHGDKKRLDIALALATDPKLLLLDEPTAGVGPDETRSLVELVKQLHQEHGTSIVFIEHNMSVVLDIAERVSVLSDGKMIAQGGPQEIQEHRGVIEAYLGEDA